ncbi:MAG: MFS transporter [Myxococcaceae bacterium]
MASSTPIGYLQLVRQNRAYRNIWTGAMISLTGDWFTTIAVFAMLLEFTGKGEAVGLALVARFLPAVLLGPFAGTVADRFPRRTVMIVCDLLRAGVVLGFLFVETGDDAALAYALTFLQLSISAFFEPAEQAAIGSVVSREEVVTANALHAITWSAMLAVGAAVGGLVTAAVGRQTAFVLNSLTYLASAFFISRAAIPRRTQAVRPATLAHALGVHDLLEGLRHLARDRRVARVIFVKAGWGVAGGGAILLYSIFGERVFPVGQSAATGIGVLFAARGVGALLGPLVARRLRGDDERWLQQAIGLAFFVTVIAYAGLAAAPNLALGAIALGIAHMGISVIWVFSTALLNLWVPDPLKGRIFAADNSAFTLALTFSTLLTGHALDAWEVGPRTLMLTLAAALIIPALAWRAMTRTGARELEAEDARGAGGI